MGRGRNGNADQLQARVVVPEQLEGRVDWGIERNQRDDLPRSDCMGHECLISSLNFILKAIGRYDSSVCSIPSGG